MWLLCKTLLSFIIGKMMRGGRQIFYSLCPSNLQYCFNALLRAYERKSSGKSVGSYRNNVFIEKDIL